MKLKYTTQEINTLGLVAYYKLWGAEMTTDRVFDYSLNGNMGTLTGGSSLIPKYPGFNFDGANDFIDIGNHGGAIKSIVMWVKATSISSIDYVIDLNGTDFISINLGTVTSNGFAGPEVIYVDGISGSTIIAGSWHCIAFTSRDSRTASDLDIGRVEGVGLFTGLIGETLLWTNQLNAAEIMSLYQISRGRYGV